MQPALRSERAVTEAWSGNLVKAIAMAESELAGPERSAEVLAHCARVFALAANQPGFPDAPARSVELLGRAVAAGYKPTDPNQDPAFAGIRGRSDFQQLVERLPRSKLEAAPPPRPAKS
jgi:hypothetical protein